MTKLLDKNASLADKSAKREETTSALLAELSVSELDLGFRVLDKLVGTVGCSRVLRREKREIKL